MGVASRARAIEAGLELTATPPVIIAVVVLKAIVVTDFPNAFPNNTKLGFGTAELKGPRKAMKLTCSRTAHFSHFGQFCTVNVRKVNSVKL